MSLSAEVRRKLRLAEGDHLEAEAVESGLPLSSAYRQSVERSARWGPSSSARSVASASVAVPLGRAEQAADLAAVAIDHHGGRQAEGAERAACGALGVAIDLRCWMPISS